MEIALDSVRICQQSYDAHFTPATNIVPTDANCNRFEGGPEILFRNLKSDVAGYSPGIKWFNVHKRVSNILLAVYQNL